MINWNSLVEKELLVLLKPFVSQPNTVATRRKIESLLIKYFDSQPEYRVERN